MPIDRPARWDAPARHPRHNQVRGGWLLCVAAAVSWFVSGAALWSLLTDPDFGADFDGGTHTYTGQAGLVAGVGALLGAVLLIGALWRGPAGARWVAGVTLLLPVSFLLFAWSR